MSRGSLGLAVLLAVLLAAGCASTTVICSKPDGATVKQIGVSLGTTPYTLSDTDIVLGGKTLTVEKPGYKPQVILVKRDRFDTGRVVLSVAGGVLCFFPFLGLLWSADYPPEYLVELEADGASPGALPPPAVAPPHP